MNNLYDKAYIFGTIFTLSNKLQTLGDQMDPNLTVKQWLFLAGIIKCEGQSPTLSELAEKIGSSRQNIKKMSVILEKRGFITLNKDEHDARILRITLTNYSKQYLKGREQVENDFVEQVFEGFESHELTSLAGAFRKLEKNINRRMQNNEGKEA